jgi:hypothetical protein
LLRPSTLAPWYAVVAQGCRVEAQRWVRPADWRQPFLVHQPIQAEGPDHVTIGGNQATAVTAHRDCHVFVGAITPDHRRRADWQPGLEIPQFIASLRVVGRQVVMYESPAGIGCVAAVA